MHPSKQTEKLNSVSVVIPTYNRAGELARAIRSVLAQSYPLFEVIIVDDGSTDRTEEVVSRFDDDRILYLKHRHNRNGAAARGTGLQRSTGRYVAFLDSDDEWLPTHLERKVQVLNTTGAHGVFGPFYIYRDGVRYSSGCQPRPADLPVVDYVLQGLGDARSSTLVFERFAIDRVGIDPMVSKHQDWDLVGRFEQHFLLAWDSERTVTLHQNAGGRMSERLNHQATTEFIDRHSGQLSGRALARFHCLWALRTLRLEGRSDEFHDHVRRAERYQESAERKIRVAIKCLRLPGLASVVSVAQRAMIAAGSRRYRVPAGKEMSGQARKKVGSGVRV